jgi:hypothetical protein
MVKFYHFYHIYAGIDCEGNRETWKESIDLHFNCLVKSSLNEKFDSVRIGVVSNQNNFKDVENFLNKYPVKYEIVSKKNSGWEQVTQNPLYSFSQKNNGYVLYAHTKGSYNNTELNRNWRESMTYYNVLEWKKATKWLKKCDAVGCYRMDDSNNPSGRYGGPHSGQRWFAGTFWWSKLSYIRNLPPPQNKTRWDAEVWIGSDPKVSMYDLAEGHSAGERVDPKLIFGLN